MTLRDVERAHEAMLEARKAVFYAAEVVGHGREAGTLTSGQLDELRDHVLEYRRKLRRYLDA